MQVQCSRIGKKQAGMSRGEGVVFAPAHAFCTMIAGWDGE